MSEATVGASALRFASLRLRRGWRSGELRVLVLALAVAAAAAIAVGLFTDRVRLALESGAGEQLGADAVLTGRDPLPESELARLRAMPAWQRAVHLKDRAKRWLRRLKPGVVARRWRAIGERLRRRVNRGAGRG